MTATVVRPAEVEDRSSLQLTYAGEAVSAPVDVDAGARRVLQELLSAAVPAVWERRAAAFEAARPRIGDYLGRDAEAELAAIAAAGRRHGVDQAEVDDVVGQRRLEILQRPVFVEADQRCAEVALACRRRAALLRAEMSDRYALTDAEVTW